ncbi:MAG: N-acetyltransferase family protein [Chthoniobacterales bacterium]
MNIRKATVDDATAIARLSGELGYPVEAHVMRERLARLLGRDEHVVFVAETAEVAGWIHAAEHELLEVGRHCEICGLVVGAGQRGKGIGRRLIEAVEEWAPSHGLKQISVRSNVIRPESHPFYESVGFERYKTQHAYRKRLALPDS